MDSEVTITSDMLQKFRVPKNCEELITEYRIRRAAFQKVEDDFHALMSELDEAVFTTFGLDDASRVHIESRLTKFPLNRLKPRYPWEVTKPRPIKAYMLDRFE